MTATTIILLNIAVWGAVFSYYYMLYLLRSRNKAVVWFGGPRSIGNYTAFVQVINQEPRSSLRSAFIGLLSFHALCVAAMFAAFVVMVRS